MYNDTTSVVSWPVGQLVTVGAHDVTVMMFVEYTVDNVEVTIRLLVLYDVGNSRIGGMENIPVLLEVLFAEGVAMIELSEDPMELKEELTLTTADEVFRDMLGYRLGEDEANIELLLLIILGSSTPIVVVTGHTVVVRDTSSVVTCPVGQLVTVGGHEVTVKMLVE